MSRLRRSISRKKLNGYLSSADDEDFFILVWAARALQSGREQNAKGLIEYPPNVVTQDISSPYSVHPWNLETLLNELLTVKKDILRLGVRNRRLNCRQFSALASVLNCLNQLENAEDELTLRRIDVMRELHRLTQRQIEWQRGFFTSQRIFRSGYIYGGPLAKAYFERKYELSLDDFTLACFVIRVIYNGHPTIRVNGGLDYLGMSREKIEKTFQIIALSHQDARKLAFDIRINAGHTAYKRSIFRQYPCIVSEKIPGIIHAPLPDLIEIRGTTGLFYDFARAEGGIRNEISSRFEEYCYELLNISLKETEVSKNFYYRYRGNMIASPDLYLCKDGITRLIIECKARRMSYEATYSENPISEAPSGYLEIAKGVFQIWRFASHHRRGLVTQVELSSLTRGMVLTLDTWLSMAEPMQRDVLSIAKDLAAERDPEILPEDQIPIIFCPISDLEITLQKATDESFIKAIEWASEEERFGWLLSGIHQGIAPEIAHDAKYPFTYRIGEVLPWWGKFSGTVHE